MSHHSHNTLEKNECSSWSKTQSWAVFWFVSVLVLGPLFVSTLARIDNWMYQSNGEVNIAGVKLLDYDKYRDNRNASFGIRSERSDVRAHGSLKNALDSL